MSTKWNSSILKELIKAANIPNIVLASRIGISSTSLTKYCSGETEPSIGNMLRIAEYFDVSLDFLAGRCSEQDTQNILSEYPKHFNTLKRTAYEKYLFENGKTHDEAKNKYITPWPYNLLDQLNIGVPSPIMISWDITEKDLKLIDEALSTLTVKERSAILYYYHDGQTLQKIASRLEVSKSRVGQLIQHGIAKLKNPVIRNKLFHKTNSSSTKSTHGAIDKFIQKVADPKRVLLSELQLPRRAYNTLMRHKLTYVDELTNMLDADLNSIMRLRGVGKTTAMDILAAIDARIKSSYLKKAIQLNII